MIAIQMFNKCEFPLRQQSRVSFLSLILNEHCNINIFLYIYVGIYGGPNRIACRVAIDLGRLFRNHPNSQSIHFAFHWWLTSGRWHTEQRVLYVRYRYWYILTHTRVPPDKFDKNLGGGDRGMGPPPHPPIKIKRLCHLISDKSFNALIE